MSPILILSALAGVAPPTGPGADAGAAQAAMLAALTRCQQAFEAIASGGSSGEVSGKASGTRRAASVAVACADLYREPACGDAFRRSAEQPPDAFAASIVYACRDAYCPKLPKPLPALCAAPGVRPPSQLPGAWPELNASILAFELGLPVERMKGFDPLRVAAPVMVIPPGASVRRTAPPTAVSLRRLPTGDLEIRLSGRDGFWTVHADAVPSDKVFAEVATAARGRAGAADPRATLAADPALPFQTVRAMLDALNAAGFTELSLAISGADAGAGRGDSERPR